MQADLGLCSQHKLQRHIFYIVQLVHSLYKLILVSLKSMSDVYGAPRESSLEDESPLEKADQLLNSMAGKTTTRSQASSSVYLPECGQVVRALSTWKVPEGVIPKGK